MAQDLVALGQTPEAASPDRGVMLRWAVLWLVFVAAGAVFGLATLASTRPRT